MIEKAIIKIIAKTNNKATTKIMSAIFSWRIPEFSLRVRIDIKENKLLAANKIHVTPVNSSILEISLYLDILSVVRTIRQKPNRLEEVFKMCCYLPFVIIKSFSGFKKLRLCIYPNV